VYASNYGAAPKAPEASGRQKAIEDFVRYALEHPKVRMRPVTDLIEWMRHPQPLDGVVTAKPATGGAGGGAGMAGGGSAAVVGGGGAAGNLSAGSGGSGGVTVAGTSAGATPPAAEASCNCHVPKRASNAAWLSMMLGLGLLRRRQRAR
jgi:hypothetical protein